MKLGNWLIQQLGGFLLKNIDEHRGYLCDFATICHKTQSADVLLIEGRNRISHVVQHITQSPWSHSALHIGHLKDISDPTLREAIQKHYQGPPDAQLLIEAMIGQGSIIVPITKYKDEHIRLCRPTGLSKDDALKVIEYAVNSIGKDYSIRNFFDLGRFLLASRFIPRRWNSSLFTENPSQAEQDICSVMIAKAFNSVKFPILPLIRENDQQRLELIRRNPKLYAPSDFDYSPYFDIIKYPILPVTSFSMYRHLPWHEGLISNDEEGLSKRNKDKKD